LPPEWPEDLLPAIQAAVAARGEKVMVMDDDPTGTQTVHGVPVLTRWSPPALAAVLAEPVSVAYVLTNSRAMPPERARDVNREIATTLRAAGRDVGRDFVVVSRSDSTLRGHYPGELDALREGLGIAVDGTLIVPCFVEGGRLTVDDVHYAADGEWLVPVGETQSARDAAFGFRSSNLREWVSEKHGGRLAPADVASLSLAEIRRGGPDAVAERLDSVRGGRVCVANAASYRDLEVLVTGLLKVEAAGRRFLYRTAASFVRVRGGIAPRGLLTPRELRSPGGGGLVVAGSYVARSSAQIDIMESLTGVDGVELSAPDVLDPDRRVPEIERALAVARRALAAGRDVLVYTSRALITGQDRESSLRIGRVVSDALVAVVSGLDRRPAWVVAKGGITSSDVATRALSVSRAQVLGQALPGVPVWRLGPESRWPGLTYVVFPGNVGGPDALAQVVRLLR